MALGIAMENREKHRKSYLFLKEPKALHLPLPMGNVVELICENLGMALPSKIFLDEVLI